MNLGQLPSVVEPVTTSRLLLRQFRTNDFEAYAEHVADPLATKHTAGVADRRTAWRQLTSFVGQWVVTGSGWWAIELRETGEFVGTVGAFFRESAIALGDAADLELGWTVRRAFWRRGFASEAAAAALAFGFERHPIRRAIAHINAENHASIRVAQAIGMTCEGLVDFYGAPVERYAIERAAFSAQPRA